MMTSDRCVLLHSRDPATCERWESSLVGTGFTALPSRKLLTLRVEEAAQLPDIVLVIADEPVNLAQLGLSAARIARHEFGLVAIGHDAAADANLPAEATARELALACRLVAQVVDLRRDLVRQQIQQRTWQELAETDPLTKLPNRRAWDQALNALMERFDPDSAERNAIALFDIDGFKAWNDQQGHAQGDACLAQVARQLLAAIRKHDCLARWGGDEFALLLTQIPKEAIPSACERIRQAGTLLEPAPITLSAGWSLVESHPGVWQPQAAFEAADQALRRAKAAGGNQSQTAQSN